MKSRKPKLRKKAVVPAGARRLNMAQLVTATGFSRKTLEKYLALPGAPRSNQAKKWDVRQVTSWSLKCKFGSANDGMAGLRERRLRAAVELEENEVAKARGELISKKEVEEDLAPLLADMRNAMINTFVDVLPFKTRGMTPAESQATARAALNEIFRRVHAGLPASIALPT